MHVLKHLTVAVAVAALVGACQSDDRRPVDGDIVQPGKPGEKSELLDEAPEVEPDEATDADVTFVQMMIPHHAQALEMAQLAPKAGGNSKVASMANRIDGAQRPEIVFMAGWLTDRGLKAPTKKQIEDGNIPMESLTGDHGGHSGHGSSGDVHEMPGMASKDQMADLADARGEAFDKLFLELMINHHQGAIEMVSEVVDGGADLQINELATGIAADQTAEIQRMRDLLAEL